MILRKRVRIYKEGVRTFMKHGLFGTTLNYQIVKRTTIWFMFFPLFYYETVLQTDLIK